MQKAMVYTRAFDAFTEPKLLLYYEDLIESKEQSLRKLSSFLALSENETEAFMANLDIHSANAIGKYKNVNHQSFTQGDPNRLIYHSKALQDQEIVAMEAYFQAGVCGCL
jgi:hypothetical protein